MSKMGKTRSSNVEMSEIWRMEVWKCEGYVSGITGNECLGNSGNLWKYGRCKCRNDELGKVKLVMLENDNIDCERDQT